MRILHISADFPDPLAPAKTRAVRTLLELAPEHEHTVYSLNRVNGFGGVCALPFEDGWRALVYAAPPKGFRLMQGLAQVADHIAEDAARRGLRPDAVHGHKVSVEGPVAARVAAALGVPYLLSAMGDSDGKIIGFKRRLRPVWRGVWAGAAAVSATAPWAAAMLEEMLGARPDGVRTLPTPTTQDVIQPPRVVGPLIRSVFHLASWKRKNAEGLIEAAARARRCEPDLRVEIAGGGDPAGFAAIARRAGDGPVRAVGPVPHGEMGAFLNGSGGFALASHRETYGMVFAEALFAGVPVLHARGNGIDGLLEPDVATVTASSHDVAEIAEGLLRLVREEEAMKARLAALQARGGLDLLRRDAIAAGYRAMLAAVEARAVA